MAITGIGGSTFSPSASFALSSSQRSIAKDLQSRTPANFVGTDSFSQNVSSTTSQEDGVLISARLGNVSRATQGASLSSLFAIGLGQANSEQLKSIKDTLSSLKQLSQQAESTILSADERAVLSNSFSDLRKSLDETLRDAAFKGTKIFQNKTIDTVINENGFTQEFRLQSLSSDTLGLTSTSVSDSTQAAAATSSITTAETEVNKRIAFVDSQLSKFNFYITNTLSQRSVVGSTSQNYADLGTPSSGSSTINADVLSGASLSAQTNINRLSVIDLLSEPKFGTPI
ncbi:MAG: hypothetical protein AAGA18_10515 [Verrucomicrobiota bacterium]